MRTPKMAYSLADKHMDELMDEEIVEASPKHYGPVITDDHRNYMWNALVDYYLELEIHELTELYMRHVINREAIIKVHTFGELEPELQAVVDSIVQLLANHKN